MIIQVFSQIRRGLIYSLIFSVVYIRFFTEKIIILPRLFNFLDIGIFIIAVIFLLLQFFKDQKIEIGGIGKLLFFYIIAIIASAYFNGSRIMLKAVGTFLLLQLEAIIFFIFFINAHFDERFIKKIIRILFFSGIIQIIVSILQIPYAINRSPDLVSGTFGVNNSQMSFFLATFTFALLGTYLYNKRNKIFLYLFPLILLIFIAAGFRAMWLFFPFTIFILWSIGKGEKKLLQILFLSIIIIFIVTLILPIVGFQTEAFNELFAGDFNFFAIGKVKAFSITVNLLLEDTQTLFLGLGPATFGSRAFKTYADLRRNITSGANVTAKYISASYMNGVALKYFIPLVHAPTVLGSSTISEPWTSYVSNLAETGIIGTILFFLIYLRMAKFAFKFHKNSSSLIDYSVSIAAIGGIIFLFAMSIFDDWFGSSRVTIPLWLLIGIMYERYKLNYFRK